MDLIYC